VSGVCETAVNLTACPTTPVVCAPEVRSPFLDAERRL
jgi:hypothetical protein